MSDFNKLNIRWSNYGINVSHDPTALPFGKFTYLSNLISDIEGNLTTRPGLTKGNTSAISGAPSVIGIRRLNNSVAGTASYIVRASTDLHVSSNTTVPFSIGAAVSTGHNALYGSLVPYRPSISSTVWMYLGDATKMVKTDGTNVHPVGYTRPAGSISAAVVAAAGNLTGGATYYYRYSLRAGSTGAESLYQSVSDASASTTDGTHEQIDVTYPTITMTPYTGVTQLRIWRKGGTISTWRLLTTEVYSGTGATYRDNIADSTIQSAELLDENSDKPFTCTNTSGVDVAGVALPYWSDPYLGYILAVGDPSNPGYVYWSNKFDPDRQDPDNRTEITSPQDPLQNICIYNGRPYAFSKEALYELYIGLADATFTPSKTSCGHGLYIPWAMAVGPEIYFLSKDGIYSTNGSVERSLTDDELRPLFAGGSTLVNLLYPVDYAQTSFMRMAYHNNELFFQYKDTNGGIQVLIYDVYYKRWRTASYGATLTSIYNDEENINRLWVGTSAGFMMYSGGTTDNGTAITADVSTGYMSLGAPLIFKEFSTLVFDVNPNSTTVTLSAYFQNAGSPSTVSTTSASATRTKVYLPLGPAFADDIRVVAGWTGSSTPPILYGYELLYRPEEPQVTAWNVTATNHGIDGWQIVRSAYITAIGNGTVTLNVKVIKDDGNTISNNYTLTFNSTNRAKVFVPFNPTKGKLFTYTLTLGTATSFRFYPEQSEIHVKPWITAMGYQRANPFIGGTGSGSGSEGDPASVGRGGSGIGNVGGSSGSAGAGPMLNPTGFNFEGGSGELVPPAGPGSASPTPAEENPYSPYYPGGNSWQPGSEEPGNWSGGAPGVGEFNPPV